MKDVFSRAEHFQTKEAIHQHTNAVVASFMMDNVKIEIFGQNVSTREQNAYRHMIIEPNYFAGGVTLSGKRS
ncbi:DUF4269 domain-containing protein [Maribellus sp. YY47]|nr:DUF4269 domain-containing protein [Maribellus sp. YY47]MCK3686004.1 DUF4269 domain-containing protein [Maribellus sp. YY47]